MYPDQTPSILTGKTKMKIKLGKCCAVTFAAAVLAVGAMSAQAQEVTLRAVNAFQEGTYFARNFEDFVKRVNAEGKGVVQINYLGGPKAISPGEHATALRRGVVDMANTTASYTANLVPEGMAMNFTSRSMDELRKAGMIDYMNQLYMDKGMYYLGRTAEGIPYHVFTNKKIEKFSDFQGQKLRVAPIYRDFFQSLGATMLQTQAGEVFTALERGAVDGYGWPLIGIFDFGWQEKTKYRIDPGFYSVEVGMVMSKAAWEKLTAQQREFLEQQVARLEAGNLERARIDSEAEIKRMDEAGLKTLTLQGQDRQKFRDAAYETAWEGLIKVSPKHASKLRELTSAN